MTPPAEARPLWLRVMLLLLPAAIGVPLLLSSAYVAQLFGVALALLAAHALGHEIAGGWRAAEATGWTVRGRRRPWLAEALPAAAVVALAAGLLWPGLIGKMPLSQDHTVHLTRAWHFVSEMLGRGRLSGWSDLWFAGWPAGEDYPPGGDYWISTVYLGTLGLLGWEAAYALAFIGVMAVAGLGVYAFGRTYFGRPAGLCAAAFYLLDRGQYREGGWNYTVWWGVWPQILSTAFTMLSLALLDRVVKRGRPRDFALCALCAGYALISHPVALMYFGLAVPVFVVARALATDEPAGRVVVRVLGALGLGAMLAAFWLLPFSAKGAWMAKYGELWKSLPTMAQGLWRGTLFDNVTPPLIWLGVMGGALAAWRRNLGGIFLVGFGALVLFIGSSTAFQKLDLLQLSPAFGQVQFQRLSIPAKVTLLLLAGYALQIAFARVTPVAFGVRRYVLTALLLLAVAPLVEPTLRAWGNTYGGELGRPKTRDQIPQWDDYQRFLEWSRTLGEREKDFFRVAYVRPYNDHFFAAAPVYNHLRAYKVGFTPCTNFIHKPDTADPELYRVLGVKYVVSLGAQGSTDLELVKRFGSVHVYRFRRYSAQRYTLQGPGSVAVERFEPEHVRVKVSGAGPGSKLIFHRSLYPNWRATHDGEPLAITPGDLAGHDIFIGVPAKNGVIELRYGWPAINVVGALVSWLAIGVLALLAIGRLRPSLTEKLRARLLPWGRRAERWGVAIGVGVVLLPALALALRPAQSPAAEVTREGSLLGHFDAAKVELVRAGTTTPCPKQGDRFQCSQKSWNYVGPASYKIDAQFRHCLWAHPTEGATLRVRFPGIALGRRLSGHHGLLDDAVRGFPGGAPVTLAISIDGKVRSTLRRSNTRGWEHFSIDTAAMAGKTAEVTFEISSPRAGGRHYCFEAAIEK